MRFLSISMFIGAVVSLGMGFYKMFIYKNSDLYFVTNKNAYVGGDSYNYIINGTYATGYFVLFGSLLISGLLLELIGIVKGINGTAEKNKVVISETKFDSNYTEKEESENVNLVSGNDFESLQSTETPK